MGSRKYWRVGRQHRSHQNSLFIAVAVANRGQGFCRIVPLGQWYAIQVHISRKLCSTKRGNYFCTMSGGWIQMLLIIVSVTSLFADLLSYSTSISDCILFCYPVKLSATNLLVSKREFWQYLGILSRPKLTNWVGNGYFSRDSSIFSFYPGKYMVLMDENGISHGCRIYPYKILLEALYPSVHCQGIKVGHRCRIIWNLPYIQLLTKLHIVFH